MVTVHSGGYLESHRDELRAVDLGSKHQLGLRGFARRRHNRERRLSALPQTNTVLFSASDNSHPPAEQHPHVLSRGSFSLDARNPHCFKCSNENDSRRRSAPARICGDTAGGGSLHAAGSASAASAPAAEADAAEADAAGPSQSKNLSEVIIVGTTPLPGSRCRYRQGPEQRPIR